MSAREPLAIVGIGCRLPGDVDGPEELWRALREGRDAVTAGPPDPARRAALAHPDAYPHGGFLRAVDGFDWRAFRVSPREARFMDPQQRLALEVAWEAFEHAGMPAPALAGARAAVAVGIMWPDYAKLQARDLGRLDGYTVTGSGFAYAANRISAFFDLVGPSFSLDAMCASSLVAVHLACQSIWSDESDLALAAGVNLILSPDTNIAMTKARILSPDGRCKTFDARADGFVRGEGAGAIVIKRASRARRDGDRVIALIRGTAVNHSGRSEWIMAPSRAAQASAIVDACARAGVAPQELDYVELHGTGTAKGDPIEAAALGETVGRGRPPGRPCRVGSVKTNIGHLDSAAGIAGIIKTALALERGEIPPSLHFRTPNPAIDLPALGLEVQAQLGGWPAGDAPRLAGVTGLSFGGVNAHVVLESAPAPAPAASPAPRPVVLPVSAEAGPALEQLLLDHAQLLRAAAPPHPRDLAHSAALRRAHRPVRAAVAGATADELAGALERAARRAGARTAAVAGEIVFVFSGQGCSWAGMGRALAAEEPVFAAALDACDAAARPHAGWSLRAAIDGGDATLAADGDPARVQPALCAIQIALARLWRSWGIEPAAVVGHSVGEIAAACVAGALPLDAALRLVVERGRVMARLHGRGRTAHLAVDAEQAAALLAGLDGAAWIAAVNAPRATVVAGDPEPIERLVAQLAGDRARAVVLPVRSAFHGGAVAQLADELGAAVGDLRAGTPAVAMVSTLTGAPVAAGELGPDYWREQMRRPVRFLDAIGRLVADGRRTFVEIAPHPVLRASVVASLRAADVTGDVLASTSRGSERAALLAAAARLYELGHDLDWPALQRDGGFVSLPRYRWQRERLWLDGPASPAGDDGCHPLLGRRLELAHAPGTWLWDARLDAGRLPWLLEHRVDGVAVLPGAAYVELALAALAEVRGAAPRRLEQLRFERALTLGADAPTAIQTLLVDDPGGARVEVRSASGDGWVRHFRARVTAGGPARANGAPPRGDAPALDGDRCYARFAELGVQYGPAFQAIERAQVVGGSVLADVRVPAAVRDRLTSFHWHPALLDGCMHVAALGCESSGSGFMPTEIDALCVHGDARAEHWQVTASLAADAGGVLAGLDVADAGGAPLLEVRGMRLRQLGRGDRASGCHRVQWRELTPAPAGPPLRGRWLVLADMCGVGERVAETLTASGAAVTVVRRGEPLQLGARFDGALHLRSLDVAPGLPADPAAVADALDLSLASVLELVRALRDTPLWVVTRGARSTAGEGAPAPLGALACGLGRTLWQELPSLWGGLVDLDPAGTAEACAGELVACLRGGPRDEQLAIRGGRLLAPRLVAAAGAGVGDPPALRGDGAYLVAGGLGGLGGATARWLAMRGARELVLVARRPLPPRAEWDALDADPLHGPRIAIVSELERLGATVHVVAADIASLDELRAALRALRSAGLPALRGVVHAAGASRLSALDELDGDAMAAVVDPKVAGSLALHELCADEPLDFFVLFSSIAALLSSPRMGHYSAANAFQGALAAHLRSRGFPAQALYWGIWREVGMAADGAGDGPATLRGHRPMSTARGLQMLGAALADRSVELAAFELDLGEWARFYPRAAADPLLAELFRGPASATAGAPDAADGAAGGRLAPEADHDVPADVARRVTAAIADVLRVPEVRAEHSLADLGFDSLMAAELRVRIEADTGVRIPMLHLLQQPTVGALAAVVAGAPA